MRKLKLQVFITVDGFVAGPNGEADWAMKADEKQWQLINELADSSDTLLLGRKMAEDFMPHFEGFDFEEGMRLNEDLLMSFLLVRGISFPSLKYNNRTDGAQHQCHHRYCGECDRWQ